MILDGMKNCLVIGCRFYHDDHAKEWYEAQSETTKQDWRKLCEEFTESFHGSDELSSCVTFYISNNYFISTLFVSNSLMTKARLYRSDFFIPVRSFPSFLPLVVLKSKFVP